MSMQLEMLVDLEVVKVQWESCTYRCWFVAKTIQLAHMHL